MRQFTRISCCLVLILAMSGVANAAVLWSEDFEGYPALLNELAAPFTHIFNTPSARYVESDTATYFGVGAKAIYNGDHNHNNAGVWVDLPGFVAGGPNLLLEVDVAPRYMSGNAASFGFGGPGLIGLMLSLNGTTGAWSVVGSASNDPTAPVPGKVGATGLQTHLTLEADLVGNRVRGIVDDGIGAPGVSAWRVLDAVPAATLLARMMLLSGSSGGPWCTMDADNFSFTQVPEPVTLSILGLGLIGVLARRRR